MGLVDIFFPFANFYIFNLLNFFPQKIKMKKEKIGATTYFRKQELPHLTDFHKEKILLDDILVTYLSTAAALIFYVLLFYQTRDPSPWQLLVAEVEDIA